MPEPISLILLALGKVAATHSAHAAVAHTVVGGTVAGTTTAGSAHMVALLFAGVAVGTTVYAICVCLKKLVEAGIFSQSQAKAYKEKAMTSSETTRKEMLHDAEALCEKYGLEY
jgi:hypothetical protein